MGHRYQSSKRLRNRGKGKEHFVTGTLHSKSEKFFLDICESVYGVKIERQFLLGSRFYDGRFGNHLLEIDGSRWHSRPADRERDLLKERIAKKFGFELHRIRLNKTDEVPMALEQYKELLDEIFKNGSDTKSTISSSTKQN